MTEPSKHQYIIEVRGAEKNTDADKLVHDVMMTAARYIAGRLKESGVTDQGITVALYSDDCFAAQKELLN